MAAGAVAGFSGTITPMACELTDLASVKACADQVKALGKPLDILICNAGFTRDSVIFNMTEEDFDNVVRVHLKGHFAPMKFASIYWRERSKACHQPSKLCLGASNVCPEASNG